LILGIYRNEQRSAVREARKVLYLSKHTGSLASTSVRLF
jgi:hypothetical protein